MYRCLGAGELPDLVWVCAHGEATVAGMTKRPRPKAGAINLRRCGRRQGSRRAGWARANGQLTPQDGGHRGAGKPVEDLAGAGTAAAINGRGSADTPVVPLDDRRRDQTDVGPPRAAAALPWPSQHRPHGGSHDRQARRRLDQPRLPRAARDLPSIRRTTPPNRRQVDRRRNRTKPGRRPASSTQSRARAQLIELGSSLGILVTGISARALTEAGLWPTPPTTGSAHGGDSAVLRSAASSCTHATAAAAGGCQAGQTASTTPTTRPRCDVRSHSTRIFAGHGVAGHKLVTA